MGKAAGSEGMKLLSVCCGIGGTAVGLARALGTDDVTGVDVNPQPDFPYEFIQAEGYQYLRDYWQEYDVIEVAPPCQAFTIARNLARGQGKPGSSYDLLTPVLMFLGEVVGDQRVWVVENVAQARKLMPTAVQVCGSSFGLKVQRHRLFESNVPLRRSVCDHSIFDLDPFTGKPRPWGVYYVPGDDIPKGGRTALDLEHAKELMGIPWATSWDTIKEAIPPAYGEYIGAQIKGYV